MWPISIDARWQIEAAPDEHTEMRYPIRASEFANRRLSGPASCVAQQPPAPSPCTPGADRAAVPNMIDNEHQSALLAELPAILPRHPDRAIG